MAEPTASTAGAILLTAPLITLITGLDPALIFAAFSGSVVFVLSSDDMTTLRKMLLFIPSFSGGIIVAPLATSVLRFLLPPAIEVSPGIGALVASALVVKTLHWLLANDPDSLLNKWRGVSK